MKVYITKWALTKGILVAEGEQVSREHVVVRGAVPWQDFKFGLGEWHTDPVKAEARATGMRAAKLIQLDQQANKLREMVFTAPELI